MKLSTYSPNNPVYDMLQQVGYHAQQLRWLLDAAEDALTEDEARDWRSEARKFETEMRSLADEIVQEHQRELRKAQAKNHVVTSFVSAIIGVTIALITIKVIHG